METKTVTNLLRYTELKDILFRYKRSQILEVYFARLDGRENSNPALEELYELSLDDLKLFLSGKFQEDQLLQQLSKLHSPISENSEVNS